ncbi:MAG: adenosylcobalamin-dependent ribonucleoside-diphosphate reductase, partial [Nanoarchaeota archaeon]|nr:adenosylcobalamin-dependent ribonucleoside-diphosphate reductase [Nanoarchaeota archaeon]
MIKQGGRRRGANMGILSVDHPDIIKFILAKKDTSQFQNFNLSVAVTDDFMRAVERKGYYDILNPHTKKAMKKMKAKEVFDIITTAAWETGEPGIIFIDEINRHNPTPTLGDIESTNPCGEQPLLPYEACNLGSINLGNFVSEGKIQWTKLRNTVHDAVHFLDNVIDMNKFPLKQIETITRSNRKIGLGVMGFADMLIQLKMPYNSEQALHTAEKIMQFIQTETRKASAALAEERGSFKNFRISTWKKYGLKRMRNAALTTVAPTGSISIIGGCSSGIEPIFALSYVRTILGGVEMLEVNPYFEQMAKQRGFYSKELMINIARTGSIQDMKEIPSDLKKIFVTAHDISPEWHVR